MVPIASIPADKTAIRKSRCFIRNNCFTPPEVSGLTLLSYVRCPYGSMMPMAIPRAENPVPARYGTSFEKLYPLV